jgi:hypothetical protein
VAEGVSTSGCRIRLGTRMLDRRGAASMVTWQAVAETDALDIQIAVDEFQFFAERNLVFVRCLQRHAEKSPSRAIIF